MTTSLTNGMARLRLDGGAQQVEEFGLLGPDEVVKPPPPDLSSEEYRWRVYRGQLPPASQLDWLIITTLCRVDRFWATGVMPPFEPWQDAWEGIVGTFGAGTGFFADLE